MTDRRTIYTVVCLIGFLTIGLYALIGVLLLEGIAVPGECWQAAAGSSGILGGLLISTRSAPTAGDPPLPAVPVNVVNPIGDPVHVEDAGDAGDEGASLIVVVLVVVLILILLGVLS